MPWNKQGKDPDYRFSLANERTFLAWVRTALGFFTAAIAVDQLATTINDHTFKPFICIALLVISIMCTVLGYSNWKGNEVAMRLDQGLDYSKAIKLIPLLMVSIILALLTSIYYETFS